MEYIEIDIFGSRGKGQRTKELSIQRPLHPHSETLTSRETSPKSKH